MSFLDGYPKTKEEAKKYRYTEWVGNPRGTAYDVSRCAMEVHESGSGCLFYQCQRKPGHGPSELYCKQHAKRFNEVAA